MAPPLPPVPMPPVPALPPGAEPALPPEAEPALPPEPIPHPAGPQPFPALPAVPLPGFDPVFPVEEQAWLMASKAAAQPHELCANSRRLIPKRRCFSSTIWRQRRSASSARAVGGVGQNSPFDGA
jgi:hypothetical protein